MCLGVMVVLCLLGSVSRLVEYMNYYSNWITGQGNKRQMKRVEMVPDSVVAVDSTKSGEPV